MPTARKQHKCGECARAILPGERYEYATGIWDDGPSTHKTCSDCLSMRAAFFCDSWDYGELWADLREHLCEMDGNIQTECLQELTALAREKVIKMLDEIIGEETK